MGRRLPPHACMPEFLHSLVTGGDWKSLCQRALDGLPAVPSGSDLGFVYISSDLSAHTDRILGYLREQTGVTHWTGSLGSGIIGNGIEHYDGQAISLLITDLGAESFRIIPNQNKDLSDYLADTARWRGHNLAFFAVTHADPRNAQLPQLINHLCQGLEGGFLVGGLSSALDENFIQVANEATRDGLSGALFSGSVAMATGVSQGCSLIGHSHKITECEGNVLMKLDGRPALEVFKEDIGPELSRELEQVGGLVFAALPIPGSDTADYLVRNLLAIDTDKGIMAIGDLLEEGMTLQFALRDRQTAEADLRRMLRSVKGRMGGRAKGALYFSCLGRGRNLFGEDSAELKIIREELGDLPLAGFYANGEISHNRLYGYTGVLAVFLDTK